MTSKRSTVTIHMVASLDGYIASTDGSISWMESKSQYDEGEVLTEDAIAEYLKKIDCYVMGSKTYEHAVELGWPYGTKPVIVLTNRELQSDNEHVTFHAGPVRALLDELRPQYRNIWMVGGSQLTREFLQQDLADEIIISIMPVILGGGLPFFDRLAVEKRLHLVDVTAYRDGMVELRYTIQP